MQTPHDPKLQAAQEHLRAGRLAEADALCRQILVLHPNNAEAMYLLGVVFLVRGDWETAAHAIRRSTALNPNNPQALADLGRALGAAGKTSESISAWLEAIRLKPDSADAYNNLAMQLRRLGRFAEAIEPLRRAIALDPNNAESRADLGNMLRHTGEIDEAIESYGQALRINPDFTAAHSNLIFTLHFHPDYGPATLLSEARKWNELHARTARQFVQPHRNVPDPNRRLKIGYVSADFCDHVAGRSLLPLIRFHDSAQFDIYSYAIVRKKDHVTDLFIAQSQWRDVTSLDHRQLADQIRQDGIDILVDLSLFTAGNRLITFAMEPAPVQLTYLAYCSTSGIDGMHYRLSDPHFDPPDADMSGYSEKTVRLARTYWCYLPSGFVPEVSLCPSKANRYVTFGCLNRLSKVSAGALALWRQILLRVPGSRLLMHAPPGPHLQAIIDGFTMDGISADRVEFVPRQSWNQYVQTFSRIDIALDPFPYNGGITTCDTLYMGVPVVALSGRTAVGRGGRSILSNIGLPELVADGPGKYVDIAVNLAVDEPRRVELRQSIRDRMKSSPLMNAPQFARDVEAAYRWMWAQWCENPA